MRLGVLDIGSNTGHLLVVDAHGGAAPLPATSHKQPLRLAEHLDAHGALTLITYEQAIAIQLGDVGDKLADRMKTFDATWTELTSAERARTRAIHLDARSDQVTVAFAASDNT